jgi:hypothetical protein
MEADILKTVGQIAGIGGLALGVFLLLFRDIIRKNIFPKLPAPEAYRLLRLITLAAWSIAVVGIGAWVLVSYSGSGATVKADCGVAVGGNVSGTVTNSGNCGDAKK